MIFLDGKSMASRLRYGQVQKLAETVPVRVAVARSPKNAATNCRFPAVRPCVGFERWQFGRMFGYALLNAFLLF